MAALAVMPAKKVELQLNLEKGKTYTQKVVVDNLTKQSMMGQTMEITTNATAVTYMELTESGADADTYQIWYGEIGMGMSGMGQNQSFTSDTASLEMVDPMSKVLAGLSDKKFSAKITRKGIVQEVMGLEEMVKKATEGMPGGPAASEQISGSFGDDGLAKNLETTTDIFPDGEVKEGDSWTKTQYTSTGLPLISTTTYTLKTMVDGVATIEVSAVLETDPENAQTSMQGLDATQFYEGTRSGTLTMDVTSGWVTAGNLKDDIVGSITIAPGAQVPDGMTIPLEMINDITISN